MSRPEKLAELLEMEATRPGYSVIQRHDALEAAMYLREYVKIRAIIQTPFAELSKRMEELGWDWDAKDEVFVQRRNPT